MNVQIKASNVDTIRCVLIPEGGTSAWILPALHPIRADEAQGKANDRREMLYMLHFVLTRQLHFPVGLYRTCYRPCSLDCAAGGSPLLLQYKLLTLPSGIPANHNVVRLSAFSESGVLQQRTSFTVLEQEPVTGESGPVFGIRDEAGRGIIFTLRALNRAGLVRLKVQATTISLQGRITYQSIFIIYVSISTYPY